MTEDAATRIDARIASLNDWRGATLARMRGLIHEVDPAVVEAIKWVKATNPHGVPTWEHNGILCTGEIYKDKVKLTFPEGSRIADPSGLFNTGLGVRRAIDIHEGATVDGDAFKTLIQAAVAVNLEKAAARKRPKVKG